MKHKDEGDHSEEIARDEIGFEQDDLELTERKSHAEDIRDGMPLFRNGGNYPKPTSANQLFFSRTNVHRACELNRIWHSRFPEIHWSNVVRNKDYVCFVGEYDAVAYAVAIWSSPIAANRLKNGDTTLELRRMAIAPDAPKNTASRMLGFMRKFIIKSHPHIHLLISYQDTDVHKGIIYKASGWEIASKCKGTSWTNKKRTRNEEQSLSDKVRWEYRL